MYMSELTCSAKEQGGMGVVGDSPSLENDNEAWGRVLFLRRPGERPRSTDLTIDHSLTHSLVS